MSMTARRRHSMACVLVAIGFVVLTGVRQCFSADVGVDSALGFGGWDLLVGGTDDDSPRYLVSGEPLERLGSSLRPFKPSVQHGTKSATRIVGVYLLGDDAKAVTDADLKGLAGCTEIEALSISCPKLTDNAIGYLQNLPRLRKLAISTAAITDNGLKHLAAIRSLEVLEIADTRITDQGLRHLSTLSRLRSLDISGTKVTDRGLVAVAALPSLRELRVARTAITSEGLSVLSKELTFLDASHTRITDAGFSRLGKLVKLRVLLVGDTGLNDESLVHLSSLQSLNDLWLDKNKVGYKGVRQLASLRRLRLLELGGTTVTLKELDQLNKDLPGVLITGVDKDKAMQEGLLRLVFASGRSV